MNNNFLILHRTSATSLIPTENLNINDSVKLGWDTKFNIFHTYIKISLVFEIFLYIFCSGISI